MKSRSSTRAGNNSCACWRNMERNSPPAESTPSTSLRAWAHEENAGISNLFGLLIVLVLVAAMAAGCERRVVSASPPAPPVVEVTPVIQKDVPLEGEWVGTLEGYVNAQIQPASERLSDSPGLSGRSICPKRSVLFEIDPRPFQAALDQAKGQLAQARRRWPTLTST